MHEIQYALKKPVKKSSQAKIIKQFRSISVCFCSLSLRALLLFALAKISVKNFAVQFLLELT
jgi:hypothetical protein